MGKYLGTCLKRLYHQRKLCDYDSRMFEGELGRDIEKARKDFALQMKRDTTNFHWLYHEARKAL